MLLLEATPMEALLSQLGYIFTQVISWVGNVATTIVQNPILILTTGFLVVGGSVAVFGRMLSKN